MTARMLERVDDVRLDAEQPELEHLEQPARARTDDDGVRFDQRRRGGNLVGRIGRSLCGAVGGGGTAHGCGWHER